MILFVQEIAELRNHLISIGLGKPKIWEALERLRTEKAWYPGLFTIGQTQLFQR